MRILVQRKIFYVFEISLLFLLFLSVFLIGTASAVDKPKGTANPLGSQLKQKPLSTPSRLGTGFAGSMVPVRMLVSQYGNCSAVTPAGWVIYGERREGDALDIIAPDRSMTANYQILGVPGKLTQSYPNLYGTPEVNLHNSISSGGKLRVSYGQPIRDDFGYTWLPYELADPNDPRPPPKGVVLYRVWRPLPGDPGGYIMLRRRAQTAKPLWERQGAQALAVALSIRCTRELRPSGGSGGRGRTDDDKVESTYNQQLGMEYAHDAATGENYWVSPSNDWQNDGPQGPGYYKRSGNDLRKLSPGRN
jgi:hypothetical protein